MKKGLKLAALLALTVGIGAGCVAVARAAVGYIALTEYAIRYLPIATTAKPENCDSSHPCSYADPNKTFRYFDGTRDDVVVRVSPSPGPLNNAQCIVYDTAIAAYKHIACLSGGGSGTVTSVNLVCDTQDIMCSGGPVTTTGSLHVSPSPFPANMALFGPTGGVPATPHARSMVASDLPNTAVTPASYTNMSATVDAQGRITAASSGAAGGLSIGVTSITSGTPGRVLIEGTGPVVSDDSGFTFDATTNIATTLGGVVTPSIGPSTSYQHALNSNTSPICDLATGCGSIVRATVTGAIPNGTLSAGGAANVYMRALYVPSDATLITPKIANAQFSGGTGNAVAGVNVALYAADSNYDPTGSPLGKWLNQTIPGDGSFWPAPTPVQVTHGGWYVLVNSLPASAGTVSYQLLGYHGTVKTGTSTVDPPPTTGDVADDSPVFWIQLDYLTAKRRVVVMGDSISVGYNATDFINSAWFQLGPKNDYAIQLQGFGGASLASFYDNITYPALWSTVSLSGADLWIQAGVNDVSGSTATMETYITTICSRAKGLGARNCYANTIAPQAAYGPPAETNRTVYNAWMRTQVPSVFTGISDPALSQVQGGLASNTDLTALYSAYDTDTIHWNAVGHLQEYQQLAPVLLGLGNSIYFERSMGMQVFQQGIARVSPSPEPTQYVYGNPLASPAPPIWGPLSAFTGIGGATGATGAAGATGATGGGGSCTPFTSWTACSFNAGWSNFGSGFANCGWYVDGCTGRVHFRGAVTGSCAGAGFILQMSTGQTPARVIGSKTRFVVSGDGSISLNYLEATTDGKLSYAAGSTCAAVILDGLDYLGEN